MKTMKPTTALKTMTLLFTALILASCNIEVPEEATLNINGAGDGDSWDYGYGDAIGDNFNDYNVYENNQGFYMQPGGSGGGMQMPPKRPKVKPATLAPLTGRTVNGGYVTYTPMNSDKWQFSIPIGGLVTSQGTGPMIGIMENGVPLYARYSNEVGSLDSHSGTFGATLDFPSGVYHYVVVISNYYAY